MEREVVEMALDLFEAPEGAGGGITTGGPESIFMAVGDCRECAREVKGRKGPLNIVAAESAHPVFDRAGETMDIRVKRVPLRDDFRADPDAMAAAVDDDTMMILGSAPCLSHGVVYENASLGRVMSDFDFSVPGVRSLIADLYKLCSAPQPSSVVQDRSEENFERQIFDQDR